MTNEFRKWGLRSRSTGRDLGKTTFGTKTQQLGLRLSKVEKQVIDRVRAHWAVDTTSWVTYALIRFTGLMTMETGDALRDWAPPSPVVGSVHCRMAPGVMEPFIKQLKQVAPKVKLATAVRYVLLVEALPALSSSSEADKHAAYDRDMKARREMPKPPFADIQIPYGATFIPANTIKFNFDDEPEDES